jgi:archaellum component FlaF (FlaF/FlaG flagellin family)
MILVVTTNGIFVIDTSLITLMPDGKIVTQRVRKQVSTPTSVYCIQTWSEQLT